MVLSVLVALTLTPALCATLLKPVLPAEHTKDRGLFGWFNRRFEASSSSHYSRAVARMLNGTGRYLIVYGVIVLGMAWLFVRLPTAFLPSEDQQGIFEVD